LTGVGTSISMIDQNRQIGTVHQFSVDVQRELPGHVALEVAYIGSISHHLQTGGSINIDQIPVGQTVRPFPQFTAVNLLNDSSSASYNAMVVKAQKRYSHGLTLLTAYTWSRNMDGTFSGPGNFLNSSTGSAQDIYNLGAEYSRAVNDTPQRLTSSASYDLPFGKGKAFLSSNPFLDFLVGNWQLNVVNVFQTGFPLAVWQSVNNNSGIGAGVQRPNATGISPDMPGSLESRLGGYLNPLAFSVNPALTFGNLSRTIPNRGPGQANWDMSLFKTFKVGEKFKAQFRAETLNTFNTPLFRGPNTQVGGSSFGKITQQANYPRYIQLGVRFYF